MKTIAGLLTVFFSSLGVAQAAPQFQTSCTVVDANQIVSISSGVFENSVQGYGRSLIKLAIGKYILNASVMMNKPLGSESMEATFRMNLFDGDPIAKSINSVSVQGMDLDARNLNQPLSLYGVNFLDGVGRVDYNCSITKVSH